jgi:hypothetical protein
VTLIPPPEVDQNTLAAWYEAKKQLDALKAKEMLLRTRIFRFFFPSAKEGTNTHELPDKFQLKGTRVVNRKIVEESMQALCHRPTIGMDGHGNALYGPSKLEAAGVRVDMLIKWKPELAITVYRELTAEQQHLVDQMLLIDDGSPQLKIDPPKAPRGKKGDKTTPDDIEETKGPQS